MKKTLAIILCIAMIAALVFTMGACGKKPAGNNDKPASDVSNNDKPADSGKNEIKGDVIDSTEFKATCPNGWLNVKQTDVFGDQDEDGNYPLKTNTLAFYKGAKSEWDVFSCPGITIYLLDKDESVDSTIEGLSWLAYNEVTETTFSVNGKDVRGVIAKGSWLSDVEAYDIAFVPVGDRTFQITIMTTNDEEKPTGISMADAEVQGIIGSIALD